MANKENRESMPTPVPVQIKLEEDALQSNVYCWKCAKGTNTNLRCTKCPRHFHETCVKNRTEADWICDECSNKDYFVPFDVKFIPNILESVEKQFASLKDVHFTAEQTQNTIDIAQMKQKSYENVQQFEDDLKWFRHNCRSVYAHERKLQSVLKGLIDQAKDQIDDILACDECYQAACKYGTKSFVMTCSKPHLVIWYRLDNSTCYWPAKVMAVDVEKGIIRIRLFHDYTKKYMSNDHDYLFSTEHPTKKVSHRKSDDIVIKEVNEYIENVRLKFGAYNYAKHRTTFEPEKIQEYLEQMIAQNHSSDSDEIESNASESSSNDTHANFEVGDTEDSMPQRTTNRSAANGPPLKRVRCKNEVNHLLDTMENNMKIYIEHEKLKMKRGIGQHLENHLNETNNEKMALEQMIDTLNVEKEGLERDNAALKVQQNDENKRFDAEKLTFEKKIADLEEARRTEKTLLENKIAALALKIAASELKVAALELKIGVTEKMKLLKKNEINCVHCQTVLQPIMFCSSDCGKKHYESSQ